MIRRLTSHDEAEVMPPPESKAKLTKAEIELIKRWIDEGAVYEPLWSFSVLVAPPVPIVAKTLNPVDAFLEAELARQSQMPNAEADRPTLIRRVAFALTGLPPTLKEVDAYLADNAPGGHERMVDRYLASPRYGEEMAGTGSTSSATPTPTACTSTTNAASGRIATGSCGHSTKTSGSTRLPSNNSRATCCRTRRKTNSSPRASTAAT